MTDHTPDDRKSLFRTSILYIFILFCLIFLFYGMLTMLNATTLSGTLKQGGQPLTGYIDINLVYPGSTGSSLALPSTCPGSPTCHVPVYNGHFPSMDVEGNDTLLPRGTYYQVTYYDAYANPIARMPYVITGATYDLGTAVPTPVTTSNINFLDLLGLRSLSVNFLQVNNSIQIGGHGATFTPAGIIGAQQFDDTRWTNGYLAGSTTCGVQEAVNSLGAGGGTVFLAGGTCTVVTGINITSPVTLIGMGMDATILINASGNTLINITPPSTGILFGVKLSGMTLQGAGTGSGLNNVQMNGGAGILANPALDHVRSIGGQYGLTTSGAVQSLSISYSVLDQNQVGLGLTGAVLNTTIANSNFDTNTQDGLQVSGSGVGVVTVIGSTFNNSANRDGLEVVPGAFNAVIHAYSSQFSNNLSAGLFLGDGSGHTVDSSQFQPGVHQQYGVNISVPTLADAFTTQVTLKDNLLRDNLTADVFTSATPTYVLIYPQSEQVGSTAVHYSFTDPTKVHFVIPDAVTRTCNSNGCWTKQADGTIHAWGTATGCTTTSGQCTASASFPTGFTTTTNLSVVMVCKTGTTNCSAGLNSVSTSGFTFDIGAFVRIGGSGGDLTGSINWTADGN